MHTATIPRKLARLLPCALLLASIPCMGQTAAAPDTSILRLDPSLDRLISLSAHIELVATGFTFTEGPMWRHGRLWFQDEEDDKTWALTPSGEKTVLVDYKQPPYALPNAAKLGPNGMAPAPDGSVVMCEQYKRAVEKLVGDPTHGPLQLIPFFDNYEGHHLNSPNDIVFARDGSFYFTDPNYGLKGREHDPAKQLPYQAVFHWKNGKLTPVITNLTTPNGLALSPDERTLYVNNSGPDQRIVAFPVHPDGTTGPGRNLITFSGHEGPGVPDGMKLDTEGNLWTTGPGGIRILTPEGKVLGQLKLPLVAANLAWGEDGHALYITARGSIYRLRTIVAGHMPAFSK